MNKFLHLTGIVESDKKNKTENFMQKNCIKNYNKKSFPFYLYTLRMMHFSLFLLLLYRMQHDWDSIAGISQNASNHVNIFCTTDALRLHIPNTPCVCGALCTGTTNANIVYGFFSSTFIFKPGVYLLYRHTESSMLNTHTSTSTYMRVRKYYTHITHIMCHTIP